MMGFSVLVTAPDSALEMAVWRLRRGRQVNLVLHFLELGWRGLPAVRVIRFHVEGEGRARAALGPPKPRATVAAHRVADANLRGLALLSGHASRDDTCLNDSSIMKHILSGKNGD